MIRIYKTQNGQLTQIDEYRQNTWIQMVNPSDDEIKEIAHLTNVDEDYLEAALDRQEISRIELDEESGSALIALNAPYEPSKETPRLYETIPVGIIHTKYNVITVCLEDIPELKDIAEGRVKNVFVNLKTRFILEIINRIIASYIKSLRTINKDSNEVEKMLHKSSDNQYLFDMLDLEKSTVFFSTALNSNKLVVEKLSRGRIIPLYEADSELLEDIQIEVEQAVNMCTIYSNILSGTMDAFASIISNNLNIVMKILTIITIVISVPTGIFSLFGMNVPLPVSSFWGIVYLSLGLSVLTALIVWFINRNMDFHLFK